MEDIAALINKMHFANYNISPVFHFSGWISSAEKSEKSEKTKNGQITFLCDEY